MAPSRQHYLIFVALAVAVLFAVHFYPFAFANFHLINYDDEIFIRPMLKLGIAQYFKIWFPNPLNYAYPFRDLTLFMDGWLSEQLGFATFALTNFVIFVATVVALDRIFAIVVPHRPLLRLFFVVVVALHPLNVEVVQWASTRKNILPPLFIAYANAIVLRRWLAEEMPSWREVVGLVVAQCLSLACYPVTILWLPWVVVMFGAVLPAERRLTRPVFAALLVITLAISLVYLQAFAASEGTDFKDRFRAFAFELDRVVFFLVRASGRGFYNTLFPEQLAIYYDADNLRSFVGFALLLGYLVGVATWLRGVQERSDRRLLFALGSLVLILLAPEAHVFLSFPDFRWADRYSYIANPYFLMFNVILVLASQQGQALVAHLARLLAPWLSKRGLLAGLAIGLVALTYVGASRRQVPLWRDEMLIEEDCARREGAPKCLAIMMSEYFTEDCRKAREYIDLGYERYASSQPKYSAQFMHELPFYDATCIALTASLKAEDKTHIIPPLFDRYPGSPGPVFGLVLAYLEARNTKEAYELAKTYYLGGHPEVLVTSKLLIEIYLGHSQALCEIVKDEQCFANLEIARRSQTKIPPHSFPSNWGYKITKLMHERGLKNTPPSPPPAP